MKRWNHQFETQIRRDSFRLEVDKFQPVRKQPFKLEPVRNQFGNSSTSPEIEKAGSSALEQYSSKPVRKQSPVRNIEFLTVTSSENLSFHTKRRIGMFIGSSMVLRRFLYDVRGFQSIFIVF